MVVRPIVYRTSPVSSAKSDRVLSLLSGYKLVCTDFPRLRVFMSQGGQRKTKAAAEKATASAPCATGPSPVQRGLEMLWDLLGTTQGYEMPVAEFFPATVRFCLQQKGGFPSKF